MRWNWVSQCLILPKLMSGDDSEEMLGRALGNRDDVVVATKMCRVRETGEQDYSAERMMKTAEGSLRRLQRDVIDIYQLHSPRRRIMERYNWAEGMAR